MSIEKLDMQSPNLVNDNLDRLAELFPNCVTESAEGKAVDFDLLKQELSSAVVEGNKERYRLEWPGKKEAIVTANLPTTKTLRPIREDSVDFDNTENIYIEGDNLEVLKILQESYLGKIKLIYIDPPYNTGKDFVYKDNYSKDSQQELMDSGQKDEYNQRLVVNPETSGRYHSEWLTMMYPRLKLARNLLTDDGVIFISIDDNELHNLKKLCDEIFGEINFRNYLLVRRRIKSLNVQFAEQGLKSMNIGFEFLLVFSKSAEFTYKALRLKKENIPLTGTWNVFWSGADRPTMRYELLGFKPLTGQWRWSREKAEEAANNYTEFINNFYHEMTLEEYWTLTGETKKFVRRIEGGIGNNGGVQYWIPPSSTSLRTSNWTDIEVSQIHKEFDLPFDNPKSTKLIDTIIDSIDSNDFIALDFFSGSATTAHSILNANYKDFGKRKFILVQLPALLEGKDESQALKFKNLCSIGEERIRRVSIKIKTELEDLIRSENNKLKSLEDNYEIEINTFLKDPNKIQLIKKEIEHSIQILKELENKNTQLDLGFRIYQLDTSNMQDVYHRPQEYKQGFLDMFADNIKPDRSSDDLLAQVMLDWGLPLSLKIEQATICSKQIFKVAGNSLVACFDHGLDESFARELAKERPLRVVVRDNGFKDDTAKTNVRQLLKQLSPETELKVI